MIYLAASKGTLTLRALQDLAAHEEELTPEQVDAVAEGLLPHLLKRLESKGLLDSQAKH
jgi:hypothetical protein